MSTTELFALATLVIAFLGYFFLERRSTLASFQKLGGRQLPIMNRIVGEYVNLPPGTLVPRSGNYECIICAKGGYQDTSVAAIFGQAEAERRAKNRKVTRTFFQSGAKLPICPNCGEGAGWTLLRQ